MNKPNIIFIHVDQLKQSAIGAQGCDRVQTPWIDQIMNAGVRFEQSYAACPVCIPARTAWYTGLEPEQSGITENGRWINRDQVDVTELGTWLKDRAGYDCFYMGKWHIAIRPQECGFKQLHASHHVGEYGDTALSRAAEDFLLNHTGEKPFFLSVGLLNPHDICYWSWPYSPGKIGLANEISAELPSLPPNFIADSEKADWNELEWRFYAHAYFRFIEMVDQEIGRIYRAFQRSPQKDNTVFIFSSDHGQASGEHGFLTKGTPYEHSLRVPLVFIDPQAAPRRDSDHLISGLDLAPTLCDYAGAPALPGSNGKSMKPLVQGQKTEWRGWMATTSPLLRHRIILKGDYKLIYTRKGGRVELFNLADDPYEMNDLSRNPESKAVLDELLALREEYDVGRNISPVAQADLDRWK